MNVYEFEKSLLQRLEESTNVLHLKNAPVSAAEVRGEWAYFVELQIEPAGTSCKVKCGPCILILGHLNRLAGTLEDIASHVRSIEDQISNSRLWNDKQCFLQ